LAAVVLRRNLTPPIEEGDDCMWKSLNSDTKEYLKKELLEALQSEQERSLMHKISDLICEVGGSVKEVDNIIWQDLLVTIHTFVTSQNVIHVEAALKIYNGLFAYISDEMIKHKKELYSIFETTLSHPNLDVNLSSLQAMSQLLQIIERTDTKDFQALLPQMVNVPLKALEQDDEVVLEDALSEFIEIAESEPKFFKA
jgi:hypothetical protein